MKFLIIDDERIARDGLAAQLRSLVPSAVIFEADCLQKGRILVLEQKMEGVFLDLDMPGGNGLEYLPELSVMKIPVVLVTGDDSQATTAFDHGVVDYLLKPFSTERLGRSLARLRERLTVESGKVVLFCDQVQCWPVNLDEIIMVEATGSYVTIRTSKGREITLCKSLREVEDLLDKHSFVRANRSQIVRLDCVESIRKEKGGLLSATLGAGTTIKFSRRQAQSLRERFAI